jgi:DNA mismatch repair protein MutS2
MSRCGLPVCAENDSEIPFFESILAVIGDSQSVDQHLSTFAAHLKTLTEATQAKGSNHLLLIDEICGSTDPEEGAALAKSFIEHFDQNKVFGVITSHLGPLKEEWPKESGIFHGRLDYDEIGGKPTYKLFLGLPGQSLTLKTTKSIGVPQAILDRALSLMSPETRTRHSKITELEKLKNEMEEVKAKAYDEQRLA